MQERPQALQEWISHYSHTYADIFEPKANGLQEMELTHVLGPNEDNLIRNAEICGETPHRAASR